MLIFITAIVEGLRMRLLKDIFLKALKDKTKYRMLKKIGNEQYSDKSLWVVLVEDLEDNKNKYPNVERTEYIKVIGKLLNIMGDDGFVNIKYKEGKPIDYSKTMIEDMIVNGLTEKGRNYINNFESVPMIVIAIAAIINVIVVISQLV